MKLVLSLLLSLLCGSAFADDDVAIPESYRTLIKTTDLVEVVGTNEAGGPENFSIHNDKAIHQFVDFLTSDRYTAVAKNLKPDIKSPTSYHIRLSSHGAVILEFQMIAESILDLPNEPDYYMQSDRHSDNLMAPLMRLR